ncbi:hypothetical protein HWD97_02475 [Ochrobactrum sp. C6C9]|uniref:hypothetical protein n=1 Tax=Ochrobactrum sp. C6C9 TaxID=2736662 RepID=UPI0035300646|nr:hypothetical protein [Ochrobactrum sp. C6C9]
MKVVTGNDGKIYVANAHGGIMAGPFETNAQAWRAADRISGEPVSRSEKVSMWINEQNGDAA